MAPVYLAERLTSNTNVPSLFAARGIYNYAPSTLSAISPSAIPTAHQLFYDIYYKNIDAYLFATSRNSAVWCHLDGYTANYSEDGDIGLIAPPIHFLPSVKVPKDEMETFGRRLNSMGMTMRGNAPVYHLPPPSPARLAYLMANALPFFASGPDALTPHGFFAFNFTRSVIIGSLKTHSYAAFYTSQGCCSYHRF